MTRLVSQFGFAASLALLAAVVLLPAEQARAKDKTTVTSFDREVRAILSDACFKCHGPDEKTRISGIRFDTFAGATAKLPDGKQPFVPGKPDMSEAIRRMSLPDSDPEKMPPVSSNKKVSAEQLELMKAWVSAGAKYESHWSFLPLSRPTVPASPAGTNPIDAFVSEKLNEVGIGLSHEADKRTLIRRVALDTTGLPPTNSEVERFVADTSPDAYQKMVDRYLSSPHYGEKMALGWLDLARYADTHGYHIDSARSMYRWRDWVIKAFNDNLPYDQFLTWQLAGDLLPDATHEQVVATGFNRNHPINYEGGAIPEEYRVAYAADRVDTTTTAFLGLTMRCAQCHDHKYEPLTQKDYYKFFAFFNNIDEVGLDGQFGNAKPYIDDPYPWQTSKLKALEGQITDLKTKMAPIPERNIYDAQEWKLPQVGDDVPASRLLGRYELSLNPKVVAGKVPVPKVSGKVTETYGRSTGGLKFADKGYLDAGDVFDFENKDAFSYAAWIRRGMGYGSAFGRMDASKGYRGWDCSIEGDGRVLVHLISMWTEDAIKVASVDAVRDGDWVHVAMSYDGSGKAAGIKVYIDGKETKVTVERDSLKGSIRTDKPFTIGRRSPDNDHFPGEIDDVVVAKGIWAPDEVKRLAAAHPARPLLRIPVKNRTILQKREVARLYCLEKVPEYAAMDKSLAVARREMEDLKQSIPNTMVMQERKELRKSYVLERGAYDKPTVEVKPELPAAFQIPGKQFAPNRLGLANWMTDPANPLVARVQVNRLWQTFFGTGIVKTVENMGVQGEWPTHRKLLDWLASEFISSGWDTKGMVRLILSSKTYRQTSDASPAVARMDPENELLSRAPRLRLKAEFLRDQALAVSGLLVNEIGGPSVKPYQPKGLWEEMSINPGANDFSAQTYVQDHGDKLYRRGMYTFWKRTVPPPSMQTLDAPEREFCVVRRSATNTPLQALVLMNDPCYVEASRKMAERVIRDGGKSAAERIDWIYRTVLCRPADAAETKVLSGLLAKRAQYYKENPKEAAKLMQVGESPADPRLAATEVAAWSIVCSTVLNTDEAINRN